MSDLDSALARGAATEKELAGLETERIRDAIATRLFDAPSAPVKIGRFVVVEPIGHGAMGTVLSCYDPQLDRRVAVKVLHGRDDAIERERLLEEAKALARLNHPHVVTVHEAGLADDRVYMAMEFVDGGTLRDFVSEIPLAERGRDRRIHGLFAAAARGLIAAHRVGLVHRDLKPTNMLIDREGRLRIADFGLARVELQITENDGSAESDDGMGSGEGQIRWVGTPAYMAPEQFDGRADERSDQFNLCASFWEVIYGRPPYAGATISETCGNVIEGRIQPVSSKTGAPAWLRRLLLRGLAIDPSARFVDVPGLLRELEAHRRGRRTRWLAGGLTLLAGSAVFFAMSEPEDVTARCVVESEGRAPAWDDALHASIGEAFAATSLAFANGTWTQTQRHLTEWRDAWLAADAAACRGREDPDSATRIAAEHQRACLQRAALAFTSLTDALAHADRQVVQRASLTAHALPAPEHCANEGVERLLGDASPTLAAAASELARAMIDRGLNRIDATEERVRGILEVLGEDAHAGLRAYAHLELGTTAHLRGDKERVLEHTRAALADAELSGDAEAQIHAWRVMALTSARMGDAAAADFQIARVDSLARRSDVSDLVRARADWGVAAVLIALKRYADSVPRFERAIAAYEARTTSRISPSLRCDYAEPLFIGEHLDRAIEQATLCRDHQIEIHGAEHPYVATAWLQLGQYRNWAEEYAEAIAAAERAEAIFAANPWFNPRYAAFSHKLQADAHRKSGNPDKSLPEYEHALELAIADEGPDGASVAAYRSDLALALADLDRPAEARAALEAAVASAARNPAITDSAAGTPRLNLALLLADEGEHADALEHLRHAREILDHVRPTSSSLSPSYWMYVARVNRLGGRLADARDALDRSLRSMEEAKIGPTLRGAVLGEDARLRTAMGEHEHSAASLKAARAELAAAGQAGAEELTQLEAWAEQNAASR